MERGNFQGETILLEFKFPPADFSARIFFLFKVGSIFASLKGHVEYSNFSENTVLAPFNSHLLLLSITFVVPLLLLLFLFHRSGKRKARFYRSSVVFHVFLDSRSRWELNLRRSLEIVIRASLEKEMLFAVDTYRGDGGHNFLASLSQNLRAAAINWIILRLARGFLNRVFLLFSLPTFFLSLLLFLFYRARLWKPRASGCVFFPPRDFFEREKARHFVRHFLPPPPPPFSSFFVAFLFKIYRGVRRANLIKKVSGRNCCLSRCCSHSRAIFFALRTFSSPPSTTNQQG